MYYALIAIATVMFGMQFFFNKTYQAAEGTLPIKTFIFTFGVSVVTIIAMLIINQTGFEFTWFSLAAAIVYAVMGISLTYCSIAALSRVNMSMFSLFSMLGGMLLPFIFGIAFYGEELTVQKIIAVLVISGSLALVSNFKADKKTFAYCMLVFFLNGMAGVISKWHQSGENIVSSGGFMILKSIVTIAICIMAFIYFKIKGTSFKLQKKSSFGSMALYGTLNSVANFLILIALFHVDASVQYPMITGGTIVVSAIISLFMKEKLHFKNCIAVILALISTILISL